MSIQRFVRSRDALRDVERSAADMATTLETTLEALHSVTSFSWCALMTVDPQTLLPTGGMVEGFPTEACAPFWEHELLVPGFNKLNVLARSTDPVATLMEVTDGDLSRAPSYRDLYEPMGVADELRVAFVQGSNCWGVAVLLRSVHEGPFPDGEVDHVRGLVPHVARALRASVCTLDAEARGAAAVVVVDKAHEIQSMTVAATALLDDLRTDGIEDTALPTVVGIAATRARIGRTRSQTATRLRGRSGRWLRITAMPMEGEAGQVAVTIEPARPGDLTSILLESYDLTDREADIVVLIARGFATKDIAAELHLSAHTVRDHVKAIFTKAGVSSRGELVASLFAEHLLDGFHSAVHRV